ncbi:Acyl-CoA N-acyltransferase protein [Quillaja saponaria]|uniref:Acyl-CoA N-acyltransferase protein n=1 Tax=Quillaja saponaria TaxID=32244 RepID=A0AAD7VKX4_QUISA|nr:Acyl-CoA N-acyltransferase protein [Quillaja saponaria]
MSHSMRMSYGLRRVSVCVASTSSDPIPMASKIIKGTWLSASSKHSRNVLQGKGTGFRRVSCLNATLPLSHISSVSDDLCTEFFCQWRRPFYSWDTLILINALAFLMNLLEQSLREMELILQGHI